MSEGQGDMIAEGVHSLVLWLQFLEEKEQELREKLKRLRGREQGDAQSADRLEETDGTQAVGDAQSAAQGLTFDWLEDEGTQKSSEETDGTQAVGDAQSAAQGLTFDWPEDEGTQKSSEETDGTQAVGDAQSAAQGLTGQDEEDDELPEWLRD